MVGEEEEEEVLEVKRTQLAKAQSSPPPVWPKSARRSMKVRELWLYMQEPKRNRHTELNQHHWDSVSLLSILPIWGRGRAHKDTHELWWTCTEKHAAAQKEGLCFQAFWLPKHHVLLFVVLIMTVRNMCTHVCMLLFSHIKHTQAHTHKTLR